MAVEVDGDAEVSGQPLAELLEPRPVVVGAPGAGEGVEEDALARIREFSLELHHAVEELAAHERRLTSLPGDHYLGLVGMGGQQLRDVGTEHVVAHAEVAARVEVLLRQEEAVLAVEVADGARGLGHHVEGRRHGLNR